VISVKNPMKPSPKWAGLSMDQKASYPEKLNSLFLGRSFIPAKPTSFLSHVGCELILIGVADDLMSDLPDVAKGKNVHFHIKSSKIGKLKNHIKLPN